VLSLARKETEKKEKLPRLVISSFLILKERKGGGGGERGKIHNFSHALRNRKGREGCKSLNPVVLISIDVRREEKRGRRGRGRLNRSQLILDGRKREKGEYQRVNSPPPTWFRAEGRGKKRKSHDIFLLADPSIVGRGEEGKCLPPFREKGREGGKRTVVHDVRSL